MNTATITALSALSTLRLCTRQSACDTLKVLRFTLSSLRSVWALATSPDAIRTYRALYRALEIAVLIAIYLVGQAARLFEDAPQDAPTAQPAPAPASDPWDAPMAPTPAPEFAPAPALLPAAPALYLLPPARQVEEPAAPKAPAQPASTPLELMTAAQLRRACTEAGIPWSRVAPGGKNLSKAAMIRALRAKQAA